MAQLDIPQFVKDILGATEPILKKSFDEAKPYLESEAKKLAEAATTIARLKLENKITEQKAKLLMGMQKTAMQNVLLAIEGIGLVTAEIAINAAVGVVKDTVNKFIGWNVL